MTDDVVHDRNVHRLLAQLGLTTNESKCYLAALRLGSTNINNLAKAASVNRVNVYTAVEGLTRRGLIEDELGAGKRSVRPAPLETLKDLATDQQKQVTRLRWKVEDLIPSLQSIQQVRPSETELITMKGEQAFIRLLEHSVRVVQDGQEMLEVCLFAENGPGHVRNYSQEGYIPERLRKDCFKRLLCTDQKEHRALHTTDQQELRETRFLKKNQTLGMDMCSLHIYADEVALYWHHPRPSGLVIKNKKINSFMRLLFEAAWQQAAIPAQPSTKGAHKKKQSQSQRKRH